MRSSPVISGASRRIAVPAIQAVKRIDLHRPSAHFTDIVPDQGFDWQCRNRATRSCQSAKPSDPFTLSRSSNRASSKEADDRNVYPVPLLLGAAENLSAFAAHPRCLATGEKSVRECR
jgi:hypothetical protein